MRRLSRLTLIFAVLSVVFFLLLIFLRIPFNFYPLMSWQDAIDILTPLILLPIYWLMFKYSTSEPSRLAAEIAFVVLAGFWAAGQGMHLAANSVNNLSEALAKSNTIDILSSDIYKLTYFYDEHLGHYLWHIGVVGLAALLIVHEWKHPIGENTRWGLVIPAGILYGFNCTLIFLEGQTIPLGFPFVILATLLILIFGLKKIRTQPLLAFFFIAFLFAALVITGWAVYWKGFPQPLDVVTWI